MKGLRWKSVILKYTVSGIIFKKILLNVIMDIVFQYLKQIFYNNLFEI